MTWIDNTLVSPARSLFTVFPDGRLEIRGDGWDRRRRGDPPLADRPRVCRLDNEAQARRVAEMVVEMTT